MLNRRQSIKALGAAMASGLLAPTVVHGQKVRTLRFGHVLPESHPYHLGLVKFSQEVERQTGGSLKVQVYSSGQLGQEVKLVEGAGLGIVDGGAIAASTFALALGIKKFYLLDLPFLFKNYESVERFAESRVAAELTTVKSGAGVRILGLGTAGFHQMLNSKKAIFTPGDLRGMKFRVWPSPSASLAFETMGMNPTPMDFGEVFTAIQQGVVDGYTNSLTTFYLTKMYEVGKFITLSNPLYVSVFLAISEATFSSLSKTEQEVVMTAGKEACRYWRSIYPAQDAEYQPKLEAAGCKVNQADRDAFLKHVRPQYHRFRDLVGDAGAEKLISEMVEIADA
jgi:tripartite ATP-independent transporter DctP family solute receptor